jgi:hypothetical protein
MGVGGDDGTRLENGNHRAAELLGRAEGSRPQLLGPKGDGEVITLDSPIHLLGFSK